MSFIDSGSEKESGEQGATTKSNPSTLISKNVTINGRRTSIRLEPEMWSALQEIAKRERCNIHRIATVVHQRKNQKSSLTAAIRVFIMAYYRAASTEEGHAKAGHGYTVKHNLPLQGICLASSNDKKA
tara:strand:+ start:115 stop:498 length:384 start_codon:yes stop_codon:yes gene_type:complete